MPRKRREIHSFPSYYLEIARFAVEGKPIAPIHCDDKRAAKATQLDFNRFRGALLDEVREGGQLGLGRTAVAWVAAAGATSPAVMYEACRDLIVRLTEWNEGKWLVEFAPRHLYNLAERSKGRPEWPETTIGDDGLPQFKPSPPLDSPDAEELIAKKYGIKPPGADGVAQCTHEEDTTGGGYCIKCKRPKELW